MLVLCYFPGSTNKPFLAVRILFKYNEIKKNEHFWKKKIPELCVFACFNFWIILFSITFCKFIAIFHLSYKFSLKIFHCPLLCLPELCSSLWTCPALLGSWESCSGYRKRADGMYTEIKEESQSYFSFTIIMFSQSWYFFPPSNNTN